MMRNRLEYFLNAIHYSLYNEERWSTRLIDRSLDKTFVPILGLVMSKERIKRNREEAKDFLYGKKEGLSIGMTHHLFGTFSCIYSMLVGFPLLGIGTRIAGSALDRILVYILLAIPFAPCYIAIYRYVFKDDRYLKFYKRFEKKDADWHKRWKWITIAYCAGGVLAAVLGFFIMAIISSI